MTIRRRIAAAAIADRAGVAVQTVHFTFHTKKAKLLNEVVWVYASGRADSAPAMERSWMREALNASDPHRQLALTIEHGTEIYARVAPLIGAIQSAASVEGGGGCQLGEDRQRSALWHGPDDQSPRRQGCSASWPARRASNRPDVRPTEPRDVSRG